MRRRHACIARAHAHMHRKHYTAHAHVAIVARAELPPKLLAEASKAVLTMTSYYDYYYDYYYAYVLCLLVLAMTTYYDYLL